ncbi:MAG: GNAT family N-acetyltransferase, partial [Nitriliruptorales bacterium]|nr:GNAT family N-acetyltransferase [Nitriliruptorales bacterium]
MAGRSSTKCCSHTWWVRGCMGLDSLLSPSARPAFGRAGGAMHSAARDGPGTCLGVGHTPGWGREQTGDVIDVQRNPVLDASLIDALIDIWITVTGAGGAVGFLPGAGAAEVRPVAERAFARVADGSDDLIVAFDGCEPAGFAFLGPHEQRLSSHCAVVKRLQRDPRRWGRGVGGAVLAEAERVAIDRGFLLLALTVRGGTGREGFYAAHGFRVDGRLPARLLLHEGEMVEEIHMSKPLATGVPAVTETLQVRRLDPDLPLPAYAHPG